MLTGGDTMTKSGTQTYHVSERLLGPQLSGIYVAINLNHALISWNMVYMPKSHGDLQILDIDTHNKALLLFLNLLPRILTL
jgi:hypothetical protein